MAGLHFELVSPARLLFSGDVDSVIIPGTEGEMTILAGHAPLLSTLKPGVITVNKSGGTSERIFVKGGMVEVNPQGLTVLAEVAIPMAELNADAWQSRSATPRKTSPTPRPTKPAARPPRTSSTSRRCRARPSEPKVILTFKPPGFPGGFAF